MTSLTEYARDPRKHIELVNGEIVASPAAASIHYLIARKLSMFFEQHGLTAEIEANLILIDESPGQKALIRQPDVYVTRTAPEELFQRPENMLLVAEIVSPGSMITDWVEKMSEYAQAGIAQYWIIDIFSDRSPHLYTFRLMRGGYGEREHWERDVDIEVAGVRVRFDVRDLVRRKV